MIRCKTISSRCKSVRFFHVCRWLRAEDKIARISSWSPKRGSGFAVTESGKRAILGIVDLASESQESLLGVGAVVSFSKLTQQDNKFRMPALSDVVVAKPLKALKELKSIVGEEREGTALWDLRVVVDDKTGLRFRMMPSDDIPQSDESDVTFVPREDMTANNIVPSIASNRKHFSLDRQSVHVDDVGADRLAGEIVNWNALSGVGSVVADNGDFYVFSQRVLFQCQRPWVGVGAKITFRPHTFMESKGARCADVVIKEPSPKLSQIVGEQRLGVVSECFYHQKCGLVVDRYLALTYRFVDSRKFYNGEKLIIRPLSLQIDDGPMAEIVGSVPKRDEKQGESRFVVRSAAARTHKGTITWWCEEKGCGRVAATNGEQYFLHRKRLDPRQPFPAVKKGASVRFDVGSRNTLGELNECGRAMLEGVPVHTIPVGGKTRCGTVRYKFLGQLRILDDETLCELVFYHRVQTSFSVNDLVPGTRVEFEVLSAASEYQPAHVNVLRVL